MKKELINQGLRVARPKKADSEKATENLPPIRVTKEQKDSYKKAASDNGFSLSAWIKKELDKAAKAQE